MFDIIQFFTAFSDRPGYTELLEKLKDSSEYVFQGGFIELKGEKIPSCGFKSSLDTFSDELLKLNWDQQDVEVMKHAIAMYKNEDINDDFQAYLKCLLCRDLFPEKTDLFNLILEDLEKGTDNRDKYVDLFDLQSVHVNELLFSMIAI